MKEQVMSVIERVKGKGGESYDHEGHGHGWRNPIRDDTGEILRALVLAEHPSRIIEFGTAYGLSGLYLASGFNGNGGSMVTIEFNPEVADVAQQNFNEAQLPVQVLSGKVEDVLRGLDGQFDMVFLDANKDGYLKQLLAGQHLWHRGTVVVADNVTDRAEEMQDFLAYISKFPHFTFNTQCGLLVARL
jgi:predicted O-methyltransferase YrrM